MTDEKNQEDLDEVITVTMPRGDYLELRAMIKDRKSVSYVRGKIKTYSLSLSGVLVAWFVIGDKIIAFFKHLLHISGGTT